MKAKNSERKHRVLIVVNADWFFVSHRLRFARAAREAGYEVHVVATESAAADVIRREGFAFHRISIDRGGTHPGRDAVTLMQLLALYSQLKPALVHHVTVKPVVYGGLASRMLGIPSLNAITGMGHAFIDSPADRLPQKILRVGLATAWRLALGPSRAWSLFQNPSDRQYYVEHGIAPGARALLVPGSGVDTQHFCKHPLPEGPPLVLLPARLIWAKGIAEFVGAAKRLRADFPDARFVLCGRLDPDNPNAVPESAVKEWVAAGIVEWWKGYEQRQMVEAYAAATLVVLPSHSEGLPLALVEAQAVGRAVVTTDIPGCRDAVSKDDTAWLVPPRDDSALAEAIRSALSDRSEILGRSRRAREFAVNAFREEAIFGAILKGYQRILEAES